MIQLIRTDDKFWHFADEFQGKPIRMKIDKVTLQIDCDWADVSTCFVIEGMAKVIEKNELYLRLFIDGVRVGMFLSKQGYSLMEDGQEYEE